MVNTEKPIGKTEQKRQGIVDTPKQKSESIKKTPKAAKKVEESKNSEDKKQETQKKPIIKKKETPKIKKTEAVVRGYDLHISTKYSIAICKFIRNKRIEDAISDLEKVLEKKKAVPMKGEIPHRKGNIMSGRFPKNASESFIRILKSLQANANNNNMDDPIIIEAIANLASRPYGRFGRVQKKRTHVSIKAIEKKILDKKEKKK